VTEPGGRYDVSLSPHSETGSCGGAGSEATLTFTLDETSDVFITTHQAGATDTVVYVRECQCTGAQVDCNDDADGRQTSTLQLDSLAAGTYNVFVDTKVVTSGTIPVDIYISVPGVESDRCANPTFLGSGTSSVSGNTCTFSADYAPATVTGCTPNSGSGGAEDRVYYFYVDSATVVTFDGCVNGSNYDETIYIRSICTSELVGAQAACNDDGCGGPPTCSGGLRSFLTTSLSAGLYYFFADGYDGSCPCGDFAYNITGL